MRLQARLDIPRHLLGRTPRIDQHMQFGDPPQRVQHNTCRNNIFELPDDIFNLFGGNIAAGGEEGEGLAFSIALLLRQLQTGSLPPATAR